MVYFFWRDRRLLEVVRVECMPKKQSSESQPSQVDAQPSQVDDERILSPESVGNTEESMVCDVGNIDVDDDDDDDDDENADENADGDKNGSRNGEKDGDTSEDRKGVKSVDNDLDTDDDEYYHECIGAIRSPSPSPLPSPGRKLGLSLDGFTLKSPPTKSTIIPNSESKSTPKFTFDLDDFS
jgi:hypothetical protein